ncbi:MAG TPA: tRNA (adenosine(37)-N6)-dimethylallyltransferase MiaA [Gemmatimonadales bacterium]|nr:tRNA (adenosine(37)-N6)-dimethylallyltransferase MiaA [Gemmatimonadales bacterium]
MPDARPVVPILVGPTAVGKTAVAAALADHWPLVVLSADSRQVYQGLDIGTAKPPRELLARVPHWGIDLVAPGERYSAGRFARDAAAWLATLDGARRPLVVGGTGFYVRALADGLFREPPLDPARRTRLRTLLDAVPDVAAWAVRLDPGYTGGGRQRAARAVEMALLSGRPLSWWQAHARASGVLTPWYVRLTVPRAVLRRRIAGRTRAMLDAGLVDEVRRVLARGVAPDAPGLDAVGYREVVQTLQGRLAPADLEAAIVTATVRYAKRQETWFRHQLTGDVVTLDATGEPAVLAAEIAARWERAQ